mgnify:FL=1
MNLPKLAVKRPVTTIMMMLLVLLLGVVSLTGLKMDLMPNINPPVIAVMTTYPGAGPEEVAEMVSKPIEESVGTSQGLEMMQSRSSSNASLVIAQYEWGTDISEVREDLSTKLARLPLADGIDKPMIIKFDPTMMPIIQFTVSNGKGLEKVQELVEEELVPTLQNIDGVANVSVTGGFDEEISVKLDQDLMKNNKLTQEQIIQLIQGNNLTFPGGVVENEDEKLSLRVLGKIDEIEALKLLPVSVTNEMEVVTLGEIAEIGLAKKDTTSIARTNSKESLLVSIQKDGSANTAEVSQNVREKLDKLQKEHKNLEFTISSDQGEIIEKSVSNVTSALLFGAIFAIVIIFVFLRSPVSTLIIGIAIPFSVVATFVLMYFSGMSLNIMSLGGLALGVGMLVDNAIVVIENIYRHLSFEKTRKQAAIDGAKEVASAITSSTLTTLAVFLPIIFVGGLVGDLFKELSLTVTFSLVASLVVALTVVPTLAGLLLKEGKVKPQKENRFYKKIITWALSHRFATLGLALIILAGSVALVPKVGTELMPTQDEGMFTIDVKLPEGSTFDKTVEVIKTIEDEALNQSEVDIVTSTIGNDDPLQASVLGSSENKGTVTVKLIDSENRSKKTERVMNDVEDNLKDQFENVDLTFNLSNSMQAMSGRPNSIEILISGDDKTKVREYTNELTEKLDELESITNITDSIDTAKPEYQLRVNKEQAFKYGLTTYQVASYVNSQLQGEVATKISDNGIETDVRVSVAGVKNSKEAIEALKIPTPLGTEVAVKDIAEVVRDNGPVTVVRENQKEVVTITASFEGKDMGTVSQEVQKEIDSMVDDFEIDEDQYSVKMTGGTEMMDDAFSSLQLAMILAIVFVYMIMASQFESLVHPLIIMFALPLSITGVILGLLLTDYAFGMTAFIGIIILVGIVVNNAIVYIDYTNQLRKDGMIVRDALITAGVTRLRPIVMTALTTMLGLLPLAIGAGEGSEIQAPMAVAVIGGLFTSTLLTLVVIPVIYSLVESGKGLRKKWKLALEKLKEAEEEIEGKM